MKKPCEVIGRTTVGAIESGLYYGYVGSRRRPRAAHARRARPERRLHRDGRTGGGHCARSGSHRARRSRPDAAGTENGVGEKQTPLSGAGRPEMNTDEYCREIEAYLCRKNDGHLIRIVGPSFERVCSWAAQGIPFKIACQGIDAYFVRYYAKGVRRRPVQIDFCENDILDAFDAWRRAVGVRLPGAEETQAETQSRRRKRSLPEHLDRVCERVTARRAGMTPPPPEFDAVLETITKEAAAFRDHAGAVARRNARADYGAARRAGSPDARRRARARRSRGRSGDARRSLRRSCCRSAIACRPRRTSARSKRRSTACCASANSCLLWRLARR